MNRYKAIIYDIDGTLLDTVAMNMYPLKQIIKEELGEDWPYEQVLRFNALPGMQTLAILGVQDIDTVYARWVRYVNAYGPGAQPYDGIPRLLEQVRDLGITQAIVSSKQRRQYGIDMGGNGFDKFMATAVLYEDVTRHKPDPEALNECLRRLGLTEKDVLFVGDARTDLEAARNAGVDFAYAKWGSSVFVSPEEVAHYLEHPLDLLAHL